jgi:glycerol-3-phosphate acyltransferase PlsY
MELSVSKSVEITVPGLFFLIITLAYLLGSFPTANIVAKFTKGIDLRNEGSGNVGASNVIQSVSFWLGVGVGVFDCLVKGTLLIALAKWLGMPAYQQMLIGLLAVAGHNWSPFLRLRGGRGVLTTTGILLIMAPFILMPVVIVVVLGWAKTREGGLWVGFGIITLPLWSYMLYDEVYILVLSIALVILLYAKRLLGNWQSPTGSRLSWGKVLFYRFIYDRDTPKQADWIRRPTEMKR